jgi:hypothetical protein
VQTLLAVCGTTHRESHLDIVISRSSARFGAAAVIALPIRRSEASRQRAKPYCLFANGVATSLACTMKCCANGLRAIFQGQDPRCSSPTGEFHGQDLERGKRCEMQPIPAPRIEIVGRQQRVADGKRCRDSDPRSLQPIRAGVFGHARHGKPGSGSVHSFTRSASLIRRRRVNGDWPLPRRLFGLYSASETIIVRNRIIERQQDDCRPALPQPWKALEA